MRKGKLPPSVMDLPAAFPCQENLRSKRRIEPMASFLHCLRWPREDPCSKEIKQKKINDRRNDSSKKRDKKNELNSKVVNFFTGCEHRISILSDKSAWDVKNKIDDLLLKFQVIQEEQCLFQRGSMMQKRNLYRRRIEQDNN